MVNLHTSHHSHHGLGGYSKLINGLRAAASGAFVYADVRAYCSHVKIYCMRARLLSSHPRLFIHSFIHTPSYSSLRKTVQVSLITLEIIVNLASEYKCGFRLLAAFQGQFKFTPNFPIIKLSHQPPY